MSTDLFNAREQLANIADWLGWQDESLSFGLINSYDALRLYDYAQANADRLSEMADEWEPEDRIAALGYDPLETAQASAGRAVTTTGASKAHEALTASRALLDSVAFVANEGDTEPVLAMIDSVIHR